MSINEKEERQIELRPIDTLLQEDKDSFVTKYIQPSSTCVCCNLPNIAIKINKAYLSGSTYRQIVDEFSEEVQFVTGKKLDLSTVSEHFAKHFECTGAAIAEYNRKIGFAGLPSTEQKEMKDIFSVLTERKVNDLELLELSMKEQIKRLQELETIKQDRLNEGRTFNLENLIMKQETIMNNLQANVISKLKMWSKAMLQSKQAEFLDRQLQFLDPKTADFLGLKMDTVNPAMFKEAEGLYLRTVIECLLKRIKLSVDTALQIEQNQKTYFYKELQRSITGIEEEINSIFKSKLKDLKEVRMKDEYNK